MLAVAFIITNFFKIYTILIFIRIILSYFPQARANQSIRPLVDAIDSATDVILVPAREVYFHILKSFNVNIHQIPLDLSPILAILFLNFVERVLLMIVSLFL